MKSMLDQNDPLVLLFTARLRSQRRWLWATGILPALIAMLGIGLNFSGMKFPLAAGILVFFVFYQLACSLVLGKGLVALGGQANLDELLAANMAPGRLADRAAQFSLLRGGWLTPLILLSALLTGSQEGALVILIAAVLGQALATLNIYGSAYNSLFHSGQIPHSEVWKALLRWLGQSFLTLALMGGMVLALPESLPLLPLIFIAVNLFHQGWEARRALQNWLKARAQGQRPEFVARSKHRPAAFWMWGAERNPYLYRYHLSRVYWHGRPLWFLATTTIGSTIGLLFLAFPQLRPVLPGLTLYAACLTLMVSIFRQARDLHSESQNGNLDLAAISLGPQGLVENLAEVGYRPRLWELLCLCAPVYLAGLLSEPKMTLTFSPGLIVMMALIAYQARVWSYVNLAALFWVRRHARPDRLMTAIMTAQYMNGFLTCLALGGFGAMTTSCVRWLDIDQNPLSLVGVILIDTIGWLAGMFLWLRFIRSSAIRLARA